jgi:hypothetical protein
VHGSASWPSRSWSSRREEGAGFTCCLRSEGGNYWGERKGGSPPIRVLHAARRARSGRRHATSPAPSLRRAGCDELCVPVHQAVPAGPVRVRCAAATCTCGVSPGAACARATPRAARAAPLAARRSRALSRRALRTR